jgi:osmotically-inducible protein OsmY
MHQVCALMALWLAAFLADASRPTIDRSWATDAEVSAITQTQDEELAERIRIALQQDPDIRSYLINVRVRSGRVMLWGRVDSPFERNRAAEIAMQVKGVATVLNRLIDPARWAWDYDWQVRTRVERGLVQRLGSMEDLNVVVEDGVATITGTTSTVENRRIVEEIALESGAFDVVNQIQVKEDGHQRPPDH